MSIINRAYNPQTAASSGDFKGNYAFVGPENFMMDVSSNAGVIVNDQTMMRCMAVLGALRWLSNAVALCARSARVVHEKNGVRTDVDENHYLRQVVRRPNVRQSMFRWAHSQVFRAAIFGNAYNEIVPGTLPTPPYRTWAKELRPLKPHGTFAVNQFTSVGELIYQITREDGSTDRVGQEKIFHLRGVTSNGDTGEPVSMLLRNVIGIALASEKHKASFLKKGARLAGMLMTSGPMDDKKRGELRSSMNENNGGSDNTGTFGILPYGVDIKPLASTNRDGQLIEVDDNTVRNILMGIGVPGIVVGYSDKTQGYASAKEFYESGGLKHCVLPWVENFEDEMKFSLILEEERDVEVEFDMDVLTRPETWNRIEMLSKAVGRAFMKPNEARIFQGMNPVTDDPTMDEVTAPTGQGQAAIEGAKGGRPSDPRNKPSDPAPSDDDKAATPSPFELRARSIARGAAASLIEREMYDLAVKAPKYARNQEGWKEWVPKYYEGHADRVSSTLGIPKDKAKAYCAAQAASVIEHGIATMAAWSVTIQPVLEALALEGA